MHFRTRGEKSPSEETLATRHHENGLVSYSYTFLQQRILEHHPACAPADLELLGAKSCPEHRCLLACQLDFFTPAQRKHSVAKSGRARGRKIVIPVSWNESPPVSE